MSTLAAARADNFYYPPGWTPEQGSLNKYHGQHALRDRAKKLGQGILIIRFEMPFHVWCGGCKAMIAKGVRFNAEKKQIGNYHSTKIWSFKMKSACCQTEIEIHTDPKNCDYVVVSGAEKKVVEYDAEDAETVALPDDEERAKLADPLYRVEHAGEDEKRARTSAPELKRLKLASDARHADPWKLNSSLRKELRAQKKRVAAEEAEARSKGLAMRLLPAAATDAAAAASVSFRPRFDDSLHARRAAIHASSIFSPAATAAAAKESSAAAPEGGKGGSRKRSRSDKHSAGRSSRSHDSMRNSSSSSSRGQSSSRSSGSRTGGSSGSGALVSSRSAITSTVERRAMLAAKRRRIDGAGVLAVVAGQGPV